MNNPQYTPKATLSKAERIKSLKTIDELFKNGSSFFLHPIKIIYGRYPTTGSACQAAFMVSKRTFKRSVDRNRIKRQLREAWRRNKSLIASHRFPIQVILIYTAQQLPQQDELNMAILNAIQKINGNTPL